MCSSTTTTMACGHIFTNTATPCGFRPLSRLRSSSRPYSRSRPRSCTPSVKTQHLNDTCAACDPAARRRRVRQDYESRNAELVELYMAAKRTGDGAAMMQVERLVMENSMTTMERNFEISVPYQEEDVMWWEMD
ncbi:hypothetical protein SNK03_009757 [Fusarium graminearum]|nr:hypothetical protein FAUST_2734 [Fusarium austroamericanum]